MHIINNKIKILLVGQLPPPLGGCSIINKYVLENNFTRISFVGLNTNTSNSFNSDKISKLLKIINIPKIIIKAIVYKFKYNIKILYYSPAGPKIETIIRDIIILICLRYIYKIIVFHFHSAGLSDYLKNKPKLLNSIALKAYSGPNCSIQTSYLNPPDGFYIKSKEIKIIPNGIKDVLSEYKDKIIKSSSIINLLFVGLLCESKGVMVLLKALNMLKNERQDFRIKFVGEFVSKNYEQEVKKYCAENALDQIVEFLGVKNGDDKWEIFSLTDIFCFPSFFEHESFGIVLIEAMMFGVPIVTTNWRGIPGVVEDGEQGFIVPIKDPSSLYEKIKLLMSSQTLRKTMGAKGRQRFVQKYTSTIFVSALEEVFIEVTRQ